MDSTSAAGRFMLVVLAGSTEMERNLTRERTRSALAVKHANGKRIGTIQCGYGIDDDGASLSRLKEAYPNPPAVLRSCR